MITRVASNLRFCCSAVTYSKAPLPQSDLICPLVEGRDSESPVPLSIRGFEAASTVG